MNAARYRLSRVIAGADGSVASLNAVRWAAWEASHRKLPLRLVHALGIEEMLAGMTLPPSDGVREKLRAQGWGFLRRAKEVAAESEAEVSVELEEGTAVAALLAASRDAGMLVVGSSGSGGLMSGLAVGSTATQLAAHAPCPVVVVRKAFAPQLHMHQPVVVGIDGSPLSEAALRYAFEEASLRDVPLVAVHAWHDSDMKLLVSEVRVFFDYEQVQGTQTRLLAERLAGWQEKYPDVEVKRVVVEDKPRDKLLELSKRAQLVVVGSRGRGGFRALLLGSVSQALVHHAACPVMVVRSGPDERSGG